MSDAEILRQTFRKKAARHFASAFWGGGWPGHILGCVFRTLSLQHMTRPAFVYAQVGPSNAMHSASIAHFEASRARGIISTRALRSTMVSDATALQDRSQGSRAFRTACWSAIRIPWECYCRTRVAWCAEVRRAHPGVSACASTCLLTRCPCESWAVEGRARLCHSCRATPGALRRRCMPPWCKAQNVRMWNRPRWNAPA